MEVVYVENPYGVFIEDTNKILYKPSEWDGSKTANSIVILNETKNLRVYIETYDSWTDYIIYDPTYYHSDMYSVPRHNKTSALADLDGESNKEGINTILNIGLRYDVYSPTTYWYENFVGDEYYKRLTDKTETHLASMGELIIIYDNMEGYNSAMVALGESFQLSSTVRLTSSSLALGEEWGCWAYYNGSIETLSADYGKGLFVADY